MPLSINNNAELKAALGNLFNSSHTGDAWVLLSYVDPNTVTFSGSHSGGAETLEGKLADDQEKGTLKTTVRDVFFAWIGPKVGIIEKGKKNGYLGEVQALLKPFHADITVLNRSKFTREEILDKSAPLSGSHVIS